MTLFIFLPSFVKQYHNAQIPTPHLYGNKNIGESWQVVLLTKSHG
jgi:hypothetical protein